MTTSRSSGPSELLIGLRGCRENFVNQQFDAKAPDEQRLPWDHLGKEFWDAPKG